MSKSWRIGITLQESRVRDSWRFWVQTTREMPLLLPVVVVSPSHPVRRNTFSFTYHYYSAIIATDLSASGKILIARHAMISWQVIIGSKWRRIKSRVTEDDFGGKVKAKERIRDDSGNQCLSFSCLLFRVNLPLICSNELTFECTFCSVLLVLLLIFPLFVSFSYWCEREAFKDGRNEEKRDSSIDRQ